MTCKVPMFSSHTPFPPVASRFARLPRPKPCDLNGFHLIDVCYIAKTVCGLILTSSLLGASRGGFTSLRGLLLRGVLPCFVHTHVALFLCCGFFISVFFPCCCDTDIVFLPFGMQTDVLYTSLKMSMRGSSCSQTAQAHTLPAR